MSNIRVPASKMPREATPLTVAHRAAQRRVGQRVHGHFGRLARRDVRAILLGQFGGDLNLGRVDHVGDRLPRERRVADTKVGHHAWKPDAAERHGVRAHGDEAVERRAHAQALDIALGDLHRQLRLVALLAQAVGRRAGGFAMRFHIGLELREPLLRLVERQHVLLGFDRAHQLVALDIQLGAADVVARVQQRDLVVGRLNGRRRVGLDDLLLRELQIEARLFEVEFLLGGVEFEDDVAGLERLSRFGELQNLKLPAHRRNGQLHRARGAEIADCIHSDLHAPALDVRRRDRLRRGRRHAAQHHGAGSQQHDDRDGGLLDHLGGAFLFRFLQRDAVAFADARSDGDLIAPAPKHGHGRLSTSPLLTM